MRGDNLNKAEDARLVEFARAAAKTWEASCDYLLWIDEPSKREATFAELSANFDTAYGLYRTGGFVCPAPLEADLLHIKEWMDAAGTSTNMSGGYKLCQCSDSLMCHLKELAEELEMDFCASEQKENKANLSLKSILRRFGALFRLRRK